MTRNNVSYFELYADRILIKVDLVKIKLAELSVYVEGQYRRLRNLGYFLGSLNLEVKILYNNGCIYEKNKKFFFPTNDKNKKLELLTEFSSEFVFFLLKQNA